MKAIAYYRVSSQSQQEKESIDLQKNTHQDFIKAKGYDVVAEFEDDGISGEEISKRPGFRNALERLKKGDVDVMVVYLVDRIGRFKRRKDRNHVIELLEETQTHVHLSEDDVIFHWDNEKELNDLEYELNASRRENVIRGKRIHKAHTAKRLKGYYSGGLLPYGVKFDRTRKAFYKIPKEMDTLQIIFEKLSGGWGLHRVRDFLNANPELYPKRVRKFRGKPVTKWSAEHIRLLVLNDFYFTGIVPRTPKSIKKGIPPIDTDLGKILFDEETVQIARREMSTRRTRFIDPTHKDRKRTHSQRDKVVFTDALLHGIVRCGNCGWKLGLQRIKYGKYNYLYYKCRGRYKRKCDAKNIRVDVLDRKVWREFIQTLSSPEDIEQMILEQNFIVDKKREEKKSLYQKAEKDLVGITGTIERTSKMFQWGHLSQDQYKVEITNLQRIETQTKETLKNIGEILRRPADVKKSVAKATRFMADQLIVFNHLEQVRKLWESANHLVKSEDAKLIGESETEKLQKILSQLKARKVKKKTLDIIGQVIEDLEAKSPLTDADRKNPDIAQLIFQQKRLMLQKFINQSPDKSLRAFGANSFDLNLYVRLDFFDDLGNKKGEDKKSNREKNLKRNQLRPVAGRPDIF